MSGDFPSVNSDGHVELDYIQFVNGSIKPVSKLYLLPMKGPKVKGDGWITSLNPVAMCVVPRSGIVAASSGIMLFLSALMFGSFIVVFKPIAVGLLFGEVHLNKVLVEMFISAVFFTFGAVTLIQALKFDISDPLLFNRITQKVIQQRGGKRIEANWKEVCPYVSALRSVGYGGATTNYHLFLAQPAQGSSHAISQILAKSTLDSPHEALRYYEFLRRYMEGEWDALPQTYLSNGLGLPFWKEFRSNWWNDWMNRVPWRERTDSSRKLLAFTVPLWTTIWWPLIVLTLIGSRMGRIRNLPESDMLAAAYNPVTHGPMPSGLVDKVLADPQPERAEKMLYAFSLSLGAFIWVGAIIWWVW